MFDIIVVGVVGVMTLLGLWKGLVRQVVGLAGVIVAYAVAMKFYGPLAAKFLTDLHPATGGIISFIVVFIVCIIAASLVGWMIESLAGAAGLGILNRIGGGILGGAKGYLVVSIIAMMLIAFLPLNNDIFKGSRTMKYIKPMARVVSKFAPKSTGRKYDEKAAGMGLLSRR